MRDVIFDCCDLTTFCRVDELGLEVVGQRVERDYLSDVMAAD